eukprot:jgi/Tetstr1/439097/TSEL_002963.t2
MVITDMSEHHENITEAERRDLLDDWEAKLSVDNQDHVRLRLEYIEVKTFLTAVQKNDPKRIEAARKIRLVQAYLSNGRKRAREFA